MSEEQAMKFITFTTNFVSLLHMQEYPRAVVRVAAEAAAAALLMVVFESVTPNAENANKVSATISMALDYFYGKDEVPLHA